MPMLTVTHKTTYRYATPVTFGEHRMMMRPRDSHDLRLVKTSLLLRPAGKIRWIHDVFGNSVAIARFTSPSNELHVASTFQAEHFPLPEGAVEIEEYADTTRSATTPPKRLTSTARPNGIIPTRSTGLTCGRAASSRKAPDMERWASCRA